MGRVCLYGMGMVCLYGMGMVCLYGESMERRCMGMDCLCVAVLYGDSPTVTLLFDTDMGLVEVDVPEPLWTGQVRMYDRIRCMGTDLYHAVVGYRWEG